MAQQINDQNFETEITSYQGTALVDFFAPWCGPCQAMEPIIEELSDEMKENAKVVKLNVDENPVTAQKFGVMSIPTLIIFKDGKEIERMLGMQTKEELKGKIANSNQ